MQKQKLFLFLFASGFLLFSVRPVQADPLPLIFLSEVQISGASESDEFIELYNGGNSPLDIFGFQLRRKTGGGTGSGTESSVRVFEKNSVIPPKGYFLWANSDGAFASLADTFSKASPAKDNSIALYTKSGANGILLDSIAWGNGKTFSENTPVLPNPGSGKSLVRNPDTLSWSISEKPTPINSQGITLPVTESELPKDNSEALPYQTVRINEILPNPLGNEEENEFIELVNTKTDSLDLSGWILKDGSKGKGYVFPTGTLVPAHGYFVVFRNIFGFALNNSDETVSLFDKQNTEHDTASYKKTKENVSLNFLAGEWRGGIPTPGKENILNSLPETREKVPKKGFRDVPVTFNAKGDDRDGDKLKYVWDFGDKHKSYKEKTTHTYGQNGTYAVTLTVNDGKDETVEEFSLKIVSYEAPKLRITALFPNPGGKDTENEWIRIKNKEKSEINLKGFSIATGGSSKKMVNHPISEDFVISGGKEKILTREDSLFTLPNQKGRVELRGPDKKTIDTVKYSEEKSIPENVVYQKDKQKEWKWEKEEGLANTSEEENDIPLPNTEEVLGVQAPPVEEVVLIETDTQGTVEREARYESLRTLLTSKTEFIALTETVVPGNPSIQNVPALEEKTDFFKRINALINSLLLKTR